MLCSVSCYGVVVSIPVLQVGDPWFESRWQQTFTGYIICKENNAVTEKIRKLLGFNISFILLILIIMIEVMTVKIILLIIIMSFSFKIIKK